MKTVEKTTDLIIIGAGAAGLSAAITAARQNISVLILEQNDKAGKKIAVSGNGRCNIGNLNISPQSFHSSSSKILEQILKNYDSKKIIAFFDSIGLEIAEEGAGKLFPLSRQSASVLDLLLHECYRTGVKILYKSRVLRIDRTDNLFRVETTDSAFRCKSLLLASGSPAAPQLGGSDDGMLFAKSMGHTLIQPLPALVPVLSPTRWIRKLAGLKLKSRVSFYADDKFVADSYGDLLFTKYGLSGLSILDISREISSRLNRGQKCKLHLDLMPEFDKNQLQKLLLKRIDPARKLPATLWMEGIINKRLAETILKKSSVEFRDETSLGRKSITRLVHTLKNLPLEVTGVRDFRYAEVSMGGISLEEIDPKTMESKVIKRLYFAGEILDVNGDRGGFNFHFAWTSGIRAGSAIQI